MSDADGKAAKESVHYFASTALAKESFLRGRRKERNWLEFFLRLIKALPGVTQPLVAEPTQVAAETAPRLCLPFECAYKTTEIEHFSGHAYKYRLFLYPSTGMPMRPLYELDPERFETAPILKALNNASRNLAELKGVAASIPNQGVLINALTLQEARDSSAIKKGRPCVTFFSYSAFRFAGCWPIQSSPRSKIRAKPAASSEP